MEHVKQKDFKYLTPEQVDCFMKHGFLRLTDCFTKEAADEWTKNVWSRLGFDPNDKSTWIRERTNMPQHHLVMVKEIAPKAWDAICELCGGEDRITEKSKWWSDSFIVNTGTPENEGKEIHPKDLDNWHVDGDFFVHFLDSPEQSLLVTPCWSDVHPNGGGTWICDQGPKLIGQWLYNHPEGVSPWMTSISDLHPDQIEPHNAERLSHFINLIKACDDSTFHELTGKVGDVVLCHPLTLHSASKNPLRKLRIISNPAVSLNSPFNFSRPDPSEYSLIELKTIHDLSTQDLDLTNWKITGKRAPVVPARLKIQAKMLEEENKRLEALGIQGAKQPERAADLEGHRAGGGIQAS